METWIIDLYRYESPKKFYYKKMDILIMFRGATRKPNFAGIGPGLSAPNIAET